MTQPTAAPRPDRAMQCAAFVLEGAADGPTRLGSFTDEEITALDGLSTEQIVPTPWLSGNAEEVPTDIAASVALRSLIARRLVLPAELLAESWEELGDDPRRLYAADPLQGILTLRRTASAVTTLQRVVEGQTHHLVHYAYGTGGVLEEEITQDGFHHFCILPAEDAPDRALVVVDQDEVAARDGEPVLLRVDQIEGDPTLGPVLADTRALTVLTSVRRDAEPVQFTFYATSDRLLISQPAGDPGAEDPALHLVEASRETLSALLTELLVADVDPTTEAPA